MTLHGSCLCGAVCFEINGRVSGIGQCHCSKCRKAFGAAHTTTLVTAKASFCWSSGEALIRTYITASGYDTAFCEACGSPVRKFRDGKVYFVPAGTLDDDPGVKPLFHAFVGYKAPWFEIDSNPPRYSGRPEDF